MIHTYLDTVNYVELSLSLLASLFMLYVLRRIWKKNHFQKQVSIHSYYRLIIIYGLSCAVSAACHLALSPLVSKQIAKNETATTVYKQTPSCAIFGFLGFLDNITRELLSTALCVETYFVLSKSNIKDRFRWYCMAIFIGTVANLSLIGMVTGFGRNNEYCSFRVTRPGGIPTLAEEMTYYGPQIAICYVTMLIVQAVNIRFISVRLGGAYSSTSMSKKRSVILKMGALPAVFLFLFIPQLIDRLSKKNGRFANRFAFHIFFLSGFISAVFLILLNSNLLSEVQYCLLSCFNFCRGNRTDEQYRPRLSSGYSLESSMEDNTINDGVFKSALLFGEEPSPRTSFSIESEEQVTKVSV